MQEPAEDASKETTRLLDRTGRIHELLETDLYWFKPDKISSLERESGHKTPPLPKMLFVINSFELIILQ